MSSCDSSVPTSVRSRFVASALLAHPFFVQVCGDHPDLHSFPTRRSSDLERVGRQGHIDFGQARGQFPAVGGGELPARLDRKSTRLNSSHLGISYAVFCLKKKKNNQQRLR